MKNTLIQSVREATLVKFSILPIGNQTPSEAHKKIHVGVVTKENDLYRIKCANDFEIHIPELKVGVLPCGLDIKQIIKPKQKAHEKALRPVL